MELTGRIIENAVVRTTKTDKKLVAFTVVINDYYKPKDGEAKKFATFFDCAYWNSTTVAPHLTKGSIVTLTGRVDINSYKTKDGEFFAKLVFHTNNIKIVAKHKESNAPETAQTAAPAGTGKKEDLPF